MSISKTKEKKWKIYEGDNAHGGWWVKKAVAYSDTKADAIKYGKAHYDNFTIGAIVTWHFDGETGESEAVYNYERSSYDKRKWRAFEYLK